MDSQHGLNTTPNNVGIPFNKTNSKKNQESSPQRLPIDADLNNQIFISSSHKNISPTFSYNSFSSNSSSLDHNENNNNKPTKKAQSSPSSSLVSSTTSPGQISSYFSSPIQVSTSHNLNLTIESNSSIQSPHFSDTESKQQNSKRSKFSEYESYTEHISKDLIVSNKASNASRSNMVKKSNYDPIGDEIRKLEQN